MSRHHHKKSKSHSDKPSRDDVVYGKNPVTELLRAGRRPPLEILTTAEFQKRLTPQDDLYRLSHEQGMNIHQVDSKKLFQVTGTDSHQGIAVQTKPYPYKNLDEIQDDLREPSLVLALDSLQDPQNLGTLCRSAYSFGVKVILLPKDRSASVTSTVCKASAGAVEHLHIVRVTNLVQSLKNLKDLGFWIYGTHLSEASENLTQLEPAKQSVLVMGSEGKGMRPLVAKSCDALLKIPMQGHFDSLNVAQAGTVCLYEFSKRIF